MNPQPAENLNNGFLVIVPDEECIINYTPAVSKYIYQTLISTPCSKLLARIQQIHKKKIIYGIITRGSLAKYLYEHDINIPIFHLDLEITNVFRLFSESPLSRIAIVEMAYDSNKSGRDFETAQFEKGDVYYVYYKIFNRNKLRPILQQLKDEGIECMIGDVEPQLEAARLGIECRQLPINASNYENTIHQALLATTSTLIEQSKTAFIEDISNIIREVIFLFDHEGHIIKHNGTAEKLFLPKKVPATTTELVGLSADTLIHSEANSIVTINEKTWLANILPLQNEEYQCYALVANSVQQIEDIEMSIRLSHKNKGFAARMTFETMIYADQAMIRLVEKAKKYARSNATIMICGPTGSGKEAFASSIHNSSRRAAGPFVAINCATFTESLIESELFGYEKGAFTGALSTGKKGLFELAHRGTLFLDEIAELPLSIQSKLLRVIEEREVRRIGGEETIPIDVRILTATNKSLCRQVEQGEFREDLYYRLNVLELILLPLCERRGDIIPLFKKFLYDAAAKEGKSIYWQDDSVFEALLTYNWPGNVRELRNFAERTVLLADSYKLKKDYVDGMVALLFKTGPFKNTQKAAAPDSITLPVCSDLKKLEGSYIKSLLEHFNQDKDRVCSYLGISKTTLWRRLSE